MLPKPIHEVVSSFKDYEGVWHVGNTEWNCYVIFADGLICYPMSNIFTKWWCFSPAFWSPSEEMIWHLFLTLSLFIYWTLMAFFPLLPTANKRHWMYLRFKELLYFLWPSITFFAHLVLFLTSERSSFVKTLPDCNQSHCTDWVT